MELTQKREQWASGRDEGVLVGAPVKPNAATAESYERVLEALTKRMRAEYQRKIKAAYRSEGITMDGIASTAATILAALGRRWQKIFNKAAKDIVPKFIDRAERSTKAATNASLKKLSGGLTIKTPERTAAMQELIRARVAQNVSLIKSIPQEYHKQIEGTVMRSISPGGAGAGTITQEIRASNKMMQAIQDYGFKAEKRAKFIARDQTAKITSELSVERMKSAKVTRMRWNHSGGGAEPRELHLALDGKEFDIDDPPVIDSRTGERGWAGVLPNCRCFMTPVINLGEYDG